MEVTCGTRELERLLGGKLSVAVGVCTGPGTESGVSAEERPSLRLDVGFLSYSM